MDVHPTKMDNNRYWSIPILFVWGRVPLVPPGSPGFPRVPPGTVDRNRPQWCRIVVAFSSSRGPWSSRRHCGRRRRVGSSWTANWQLNNGEHDDSTENHGIWGKVLESPWVSLSPWNSQSLLFIVSSKSWNTGVDRFYPRFRGQNPVEFVHNVPWNPVVRNKNPPNQRFRSQGPRKM